MRNRVLSQQREPTKRSKRELSFVLLIKLKGFNETLHQWRVIHLSLDYLKGTYRFLKNTF